jgi:hypothetical protein
VAKRQRAVEGEVDVAAAAAIEPNITDEFAH